MIHDNIGECLDCAYLVGKLHVRMVNEIQSSKALRSFRSFIYLFVLHNLDLNSNFYKLKFKIVETVE